MSHKAILTFGALALAWPAQGLADITASQLWDIWQGDGALSMRAAEVEMRRDGLSLMGVTVGLGDGDTRGTFLIERLDMTDTDAATVEIAVPDPVRFTGAGLPEMAALIVDYSEAEITADRSGARISYALDAPQIAVELSGGGAQVSALDYVLEDVTAALEAGARLDQPLSVQSSVARVDGTIETSAREGQTGGSRVSFTATELQGTMAADRPDQLVGGDPSSVLADFETSTSFTDLELQIDGDSPQGPVTAEVNLGAGQIASAATGGVLTSDVDTRDIVIGTTGGRMPAMPDALSIGTLAYSLTLPVAADQDGPLSLSLTADAIAPAETLWSLLDPGKELPRDPASLTLSLSAIARPSAEPGPGLGAQSPFDIRSFELQELDLSVLGAQVTGSGQVDQPLDQRAAEGQVTLVATGLLELIGTLAALGILPPEQELGARMGLAFATVPLPGGAGLKTELVFGPDGAIRLNGMQVR
ncbi:DUF2125 domain-containing protein [Maribius pontilimi]|uniref:DUF2125 domain-containing protein n=1 Tax=Palleronia pontilimi TaxID=1964209 RepID=A0A934IA24_9RHOB|nr:DUF2125 domain-containing protein [Palleronia pontilimi]MBJ3763223.1 DUF2125 domain-containing protein [Palleronia pontilimi]